MASVGAGGQVGPAVFPDPAPQVVLDIKGGRGISVLIGEQHRKLRQFFMSLLTSKNIASYREHQILPVTRFLMDRMLSKGTGQADLAKELADELPPRVIAALLGMPWDDDALVTRIRDLHEELMEAMGDGYRTEKIINRALVVSEEINHMLLPYIRMRRENPQNDLVSRLWLEAPKYVGELTETDVVSMGRDLFIAGADTTVHGIANALYLVLTDPAVRQAVETQNEDAMSSTVEEAMRLYGSVMYRYRKAGPRLELRIADENGTALPDGEEGEIPIRHPYPFAGYLVFCGRSKEMYKSGGYNVYPREIEIALEAHPAIRAAAVLGVDDAQGGQIGHAFVELAAEFSADDVKNWCKSRLADFKAPKRVSFVQAIPRTPVDKIDRMRLAEMIAE